MATEEDSYQPQLITQTTATTTDDDDFDDDDDDDDFDDDDEDLDVDVDGDDDGVISERVRSFKIIINTNKIVQLVSSLAN